MGKDPRQTRQEALDQIVERGQNERAAGQHHIARHFTDEQHTAIADAAGVTDFDARAALLLKIEAAAGWFLSDNRTPNRPTPSAMEEQAKDVEKAVRRLLKTLGLKDTDDPYDGMPPGSVLRERLEWAARPDDVGEKEVRDLVANVGRLRDLATTVREDAIKDKTKSRHRYHGKEDLDEFIGALLAAYVEITKQSIGVSRLGGTGIGGPAFRYVRTCLNGLTENFKENYPDLARMIRALSDEALRKRIRTAKSKRKNC